MMVRMLINTTIPTMSSKSIRTEGREEGIVIMMVRTLINTMIPTMSSKSIRTEGREEGIVIMMAILKNMTMTLISISI